MFDASSASDALKRRPTGVGFSQHDGAERASWDDDKLSRRGVHPIVYPGCGSHANYFESTLWLGHSAQEGFGCDDTRGPLAREQHADSPPEHVRPEHDRLLLRRGRGRLEDLPPLPAHPLVRPRVLRPARPARRLADPPDPPITAPRRPDRPGWQIYRTARLIYSRHLRMFLGIGLAFIPFGILAALIQRTFQPVAPTASH
jgi:hypothetical protein